MKIILKYDSHYRRGLACEAEGFGIGAFGYYRRIVEEFIEELRQQKEAVLDEGPRAQFQDEWNEATRSFSTARLIELVKDTLPSSVREGGMNPLSLLHSSFSAGLHEKTDDACIAECSDLRGALLAMFRAIYAERESRQATSALQVIHKKRSSPQQ